MGACLARTSNASNRIFPEHPPDEIARMKALLTYDVLDAPPEAHFDGLTDLACQMCHTPVSLVSLIDCDRQFFMAARGFGLRQIPRGDSFGAFTLTDRKPLIVSDSHLDVRFSSNPLVIGPPRIRFYAGYPLINPEGFVLGILCVMDMRPRKLNSTQMNGLQALASQACALLELRRSVNRLEQTRTELSDALHAKDSFLANASHELRTPLNACLGFAQLLGETTLTADQAEYVGIIQSSGEHLLDVINDVLDLSKQQSGKCRIEFMPVDLMHVVEQACELSFQKFGPIQLLTKWSPQAHARHRHVLADATRLRQILCNLLSNAGKFCRPGGVVRIEMDVAIVNLQAEHDSPEFNAACRACASFSSNTPLTSFLQWKFSIHDQGPGIDPDKMGLLFRPFEQLDASTTREFGGTGLGLCISAQLVRLLGGDIEKPIKVLSRLGSGSIFSFDILTPLAPESVTPPTITLPQLLLPGQPSFDLTHCQGTNASSNLDSQSVLLICDHAVTCEFLGAMLITYNFVPIPTTSRQLSVLLATAAQPPTTRFLCALFDPFGEPVTESCSQVFDQLHRHGVPVVFCDVQQPAYLLSDNDYFVRKPVLPTKLKKTLHTLRRVQRNRLGVGGVPDRRAISPTPPSTGRSKQHPVRLLVVEDQSINRKLILAMLRSLEFHDVEVAFDGQDATNLVTKGGDSPYDIIFMDIMMPVKDGLTATREIVQHFAATPTRTPPTIIALTASALDTERKACLDAGMQDFVSKPVNKCALLSVINTWLRNRANAIVPQKEE